jgi:putative membrane protein
MAGGNEGREDRRSCREGSWSGRTIRPVPATSGWSQAGLSTALVAAYAVPYVLRTRELKRRGRPVPRRRAVAFATGLVLLAVAVSPPMDTQADERLSVHMLEHVMLGDLAPLLIVLGLTGPLLAPVLKATRALRPLSLPVIALALWAADLYVWHLRGPYQLAVRHDLVHVLEHACFFLLGANLYLALLGPLPKPAWFGNGARLGYLLAIWIAGAALANLFLWAGHPLYPHYAATAAAQHRGALSDQQAAGGVMLVEQSLVVFGLLTWLLARTLRDAGRRQELAELAAAHDVPLDARRIARAVAAERDHELAERLRGG